MCSVLLIKFYLSLIALSREFLVTELFEHILLSVLFWRLVWSCDWTAAGIFKFFKDCMLRCLIWNITCKDVQDGKIVALFFIFIGKDDWSLINNLPVPKEPFSLHYVTPKKQQLNYVMCITFKCRERTEFHKMIPQNNQNVREFYLESQKQAAKCDFVDQFDVQLREEFISGLNI